jgi:hypothetical protein
VSYGCPTAVLPPACGDGEVLPGLSWRWVGPRSPQEAPLGSLPFGWAGDGAAGPLWGAVGRVGCCGSPRSGPIPPRSAGIPLRSAGEAPLDRVRMRQRGPLRPVENPVENPDGSLWKNLWKTPVVGSVTDCCVAVPDGVTGALC